MTPVPGDVFQVYLGGKLRPIVVVSRVELNRGKYLVCVPFTTKQLKARRDQPNCVGFRAGEGGLERDSIAQGEAISVLAKDELVRGPIGRISSSKLQALIRAVGDVIGADCTPR